MNDYDSFLSNCSLENIRLLVKASQLAPSQEKRILHLAGTDPEKALALLYSLDRDDGAESIDTFRAQRLNHPVTAEGASFLEKVAAAPAQSSVEEMVLLQRQLEHLPLKDSSRELLFTLLTRGDGNEQGREYVSLLLDGNMAQLDFQRLLHRLDHIADALERENGIVIPQSITRVYFSEGRVHIPTRRRRWQRLGESALGVFEQMYGQRTDLTRRNFRDLDRGLHDALLERKELDLVLPRERGLTPHQIQSVIVTYYLVQGRPVLASHLLPYDRRHIRELWLKLGFAARTTSSITHDQCRDFAEKNHFKDIYNAPLSVLELAVEQGVRREAVVSAWRRLGLVDCAKEYKMYTTYDEPLTIFAQAYGAWPDLTKAELKMIDPSFHRLLLRRGLLDQAITQTRGYSSTDREEILTSYHTYRANAVAAAEGLDRPRRTISKIWHDAGLVNSREYEQLEKEGRLNEIVIPLQRG
ncbi:hypothetical protein HYV86_05055 [Candidatus Woesearchaeota archaeon]|nr:hypothetical protein [Candidatus Woesearchaeota archaeon]